MKSILAAWLNRVELGAAFATVLALTACGGTTGQRMISGAVVNPMAAFPLYATQVKVDQTDYGAATKVNAGQICTAGDMSGLCTGLRDDGTFILGVPRDESLSLTLVAEGDGSAGSQSMIKTFDAPLPKSIFDLSGRTVNVLTGTPVLALAAVRAGLAQAGDAAAYQNLVAKGGGIVWASELTAAGITQPKYIPRNIQFKFDGAVTTAFGLDYDKDTQSYTLTQFKKGETSPTFKIAAALYIGDGTSNDVQVSLTDPSTSEARLVFESPVLLNAPGSLSFTRVSAPNANIRLH